MYTFSTQAFCLNHPRISFSSSAVICLVLFETCHLLLSSMLNMKYLFVTLALYSLGRSLAIVPQSVEESLVETETSCSHDLEAHNAVVAWPGDSWYALLVSNLLTMPTSAWLTSTAPPTLPYSNPSPSPHPIPSPAHPMHRTRNAFPSGKSPPSRRPSTGTPSSPTKNPPFPNKTTLSSADVVPLHLKILSATKLGQRN